jgi:polyisoprenoid-binding protein YceI
MQRFTFRFLGLSVLALAFSTTQAQVTKWAVDKAHSNVKFTVTHMAISEVDGSFKVFDGSLEHSKADFTDAKVSFTIDAASVNTENSGRDNHLKGDDFFNTEKFPSIKFESTSMKALGGNKYELTGNMTLRDVTKQVTWDVTFGGTQATARGKKAGFKAKTTINRFDYNLKWSKPIEAGGIVVSENVDVVLNIQMNEVKAAK